MGSVIVPLRYVNFSSSDASGSLVYLLPVVPSPLIAYTNVGCTTGVWVRVWVVLVVVMLMLFFPTGILFDKTDGLFVRVEEALLDEDGLINNVVKISGSYHDWSTSKKKT